MNIAHDKDKVMVMLMGDVKVEEEVVEEAIINQTMKKRFETHNSQEVIEEK